MVHLNLSSKWNLFVNKKPTAYYVLKEHEREVTENWSSSDGPSRYYEHRILPLMNDKSLESFSLKDIDDIIAKIQNNPNIRSEKKGEDERYDPKTVSRMRAYIERIYYVAENNNICKDIFWSPENVRNLAKKDRTNDRKKRLPKSLTPEIERKLDVEVLTCAEQDGQTCGIALMFGTGLRNSEAASQVFGNVIRINGRYYLSSHTSIDPQITTIRLGGKTYNMYRLIPLRAKMLKFILARKKFIQDKFDSGEISFDPKSEIQSIEQMPIACKGKNYFEHCTSRDLTDEGRRIFHKIKFDQEAFFAAQEEAEKSDNILLYGKEKDGTAYLLRRNEGESLKDSGCSDAQIQYYLGHVIIDENFNRNDFTNPDLLEELAKKVSKRPLFCNNEASAHTHITGKKTNLENATNTRIEFPFNGKRYKVTIIQDQYQDSGKITAQPKQRRTNSQEICITCSQEYRPLLDAEKKISVKEVDVSYDYIKSFDDKFVQDIVVIK